MTVDNPTIVIIGIFIGVALMLSLLAYAFGFMGNQRKVMNKRLDRVKNRHSKSQTFAAEAKKKMLFSKKEQNFFATLIPKPDELRKRLDQTGMNITFKKYSIISLCIMVFTMLILFVLGILSFLPSLMVGILSGLALPHMFISKTIARRLNKFTSQFPDAIDLIVRGLQAGLPVTESINSVSHEMDNPIAEEFGRISDEVRLGKTLDEALWSTSVRLDTPDFKFFVISLSVQQETGGNLAETLNNLSTILRGRSQLKLKIKAMSSEGKASAYIIGCLPFIMFGMITMVNYDYMSVMWTDPRGQFALIGGVVWMGTGMFIMSRMINFEV